MATKKKNTKAGMKWGKAVKKLSAQQDKEEANRVQKLGKMLHAKSTSLADAKKLVKGVEKFVDAEYRSKQSNVVKTADRLSAVKRARAKKK
jgi:hypothetical protein